MVFPNKRAALFFSDYLRRLMPGGGWLPEMKTIEEFIGGFSALTEADPLVVNMELYQLFRQHLGTEESFDRFYAWGNMLMKDFDEVDKYMVEARDLFRVILEEKDIMNRFSYLTEEQVDVIRRFWSTFTPPDFSEGQENFLRIWQVLDPVYTGLTDRLRSQGIGYSGMLFREVAEKARRKEIDIHDQRYLCFVGFHILTQSEIVILHHLQKSGKLLFYWDTDKYYMDQEHHEAGRFLRQYVRRFPGVFPPGDRLKTPRKIVVAGVPLSAGQVNYAAAMLENFKGEETDTAVVLPDENLLLPVLQALPESVQEVNITMGYPARNAHAYTVVTDMMEVQRFTSSRDGVRKIYYKPLFRLLQNPLIRPLAAAEIDEFIQACKTASRRYIAETDLPDALGFVKPLLQSGQETNGFLQVCIDLLEQLDTLHQSQTQQDAMQLEFLYHIRLQLRKLRHLLHSRGMVLEDVTLWRIIRQDLKSLRIPFSGEPLRGLQVMGLLETRNLDFRNMFILDMNEGIFPAENASGSFIPYHLRKGFGLPAYEQQDAMFAYYFYRLLHHAENIYLLYNTQSGGTHKSEISRYILQLQYESGYTIHHIHQSQPFATVNARSVSIAKTGEVAERLEKYFSAPGEQSITLSPSALNTYLDCRLRFYYRYLAGLDELQGMTEEVDPAVFGNLIHGAMEALYKAAAQRTGRSAILPEDISMLQDLVPASLDASFRTVYHNPGEMEWRGDMLVVRNVLETYLRQILKMDASYAPFSIVDLEAKSTAQVEFEVAGQVRRMQIGGRIDRLDEKDGVVRVLDYKTGAAADKNTFRDINALFRRDDEHRRGYAFQVMLYAYVVKHGGMGANTRIQPGLLFVRESMTGTDTRIVRKDGRTASPVNDIAEYEAEFEEQLKWVLQDFADPSQPFDQTANEKICTNCPYRSLCHRDG